MFGRRKYSATEKQKIGFYAGFPVPVTQQDDGQRYEKSKGIALLIAIFMTAMLLLFMSDMIINSTIEVKLAAAHRDNTKAEYTAKSGVNLATMLLQSDLALDLTLFELQGEKFTPADGPSDIWGLLNGYPIGGETAEMIDAFREQFELSKVQDSGVLDMLSSIDGSFSMVVQDETSRININYCAVGQGIKCATMLTALLSCPAEKEFLNKKKVVAKEIVGLIRDWADSNQKPEASTGAGSENDPYVDRDPKVSVKNAYFDTLDELKMIPGWDDDLHRVFSPYLTVYPKPEETAKQSELYVNFNSADRAILSCLLPKGRSECAESAASLAESRRKLEAGLAAGGAALQQAISQYFCESRKEAVKQFSYRSDIYRVNVTATVRDQTRQISTVIKRGLPDVLDKRDGITDTVKTLFWNLN